MLRKRWAWCPYCYHEDRKSGLVYERLLWAIKVVAVRPFHFRPLEGSVAKLHHWPPRPPLRGPAIPHGSLLSRNTPRNSFSRTVAEIVAGTGLDRLVRLWCFWREFPIFASTYQPILTGIKQPRRIRSQNEVWLRPAGKFPAQSPSTLPAPNSENHSTRARVCGGARCDNGVASWKAQPKV
jgi:hypothetical protein